MFVNFVIPSEAERNRGICIHTTDSSSAGWRIGMTYKDDNAGRVG